MSDHETTETAEPEFAATELDENQPTGADCVECHESGTDAQTADAAETPTADVDEPICTECGLTCDECECEFVCGCCNPEPVMTHTGFYLVDSFRELFCNEEDEVVWFGRRFEAQRAQRDLLRDHEEQWMILEVTVDHFPWGV